MKRTVVVAMMIACVLCVGGARAYFTAQTEVKDNVVTAGTVAVSVEPSSGALSVSDLAPGKVVNREVQVKNTGVLPVNAVTTMAKKAGYTSFWNAVQCKVACNGSIIYSGPLSGVRTTPVRIEPGASVVLNYALTIPLDAGNDLQGQYVRLSLYVDAEQAY